MEAEGGWKTIAHDWRPVGGSASVGISRHTYCDGQTLLHKKKTGHLREFEYTRYTKYRGERSKQNLSVRIYIHIHIDIHKKRKCWMACKKSNIVTTEICM